MADVQPGTLNLSITRGIAFPARVLRAVDDSVLVTGTLSPDVTGTYLLSGTFSGYDLFILEGTPSTFIYYNPVATTYIMARALTDGALTDYWILPAATEPTGSYTPHGAYSGTATATDSPIDLTGYTAEAEVRRTALSTDVTIDLNPSVTDPTTGEITIPAISSVTTEAYDFTGKFYWDLVLVDNTGQRVGVYVIGTFTISDNITQP